MPTYVPSPVWSVSSHSATQKKIVSTDDTDWNGPSVAPSEGNNFPDSAIILVVAKSDEDSLEVFRASATAVMVSTEIVVIF
jgi:hypothetical protein